MTKHSGSNLAHRFEQFRSERQKLGSPRGEGCAVHMLQTEIMEQSDKGLAEADLHLCNNYRHLLIALGSIAAKARPATIIYLEDDTPLPADLRLRLSKACPQARFLFTRDQDQIRAFARLPSFLPDILRRNVTIGPHFGLQRPQNWQPPFLVGQRFATGYLYHAGFFLSKAVAGLCNHVVLRESGLNNYVSLSVPWPKALIRLVLGQRPFRQTWGEEAWIDAIEVTDPEKLPASVRAKARKLTSAEILDPLPAPISRSIASAFLGDQRLVELPSRAALLLTQPLSTIKICSLAEQDAVYSGIVARLHGAGFKVYVKPHPLDQMTKLRDVHFLPKTFPIEALPYIIDQKFDVVLALCSAALSSGTRPIARQSAQLLPQELFNAQGFPHWPRVIEKALNSVTGPI
jgi:hypothetical protein